MRGVKCFLNSLIPCRSVLQWHHGETHMFQHYKGVCGVFRYYWVWHRTCRPQLGLPGVQSVNVPSPLSLPPPSLPTLSSLSTSFSLIPSLPPLHSYIHLQACTEMTVPCSTNNITDMFPPVTYDPSAHCWGTWGVEQRPEWMKTEYWGKGSMFLL